MKNIFLGICVSLFSIVVALIVFEVGFRIVGAGSAAANKWTDRPKAYFLHQDSPDFRDYPYSATKQNGVFRIAVIGDSFTFAPYMQFDDAFPKRLERYLNLNTSQKKVEVINYGVPAYSTSHEVPVVERAIEEGADFILIQITFNDPEIKPYTPTQLFREKNKFGDLELKNPIFNYWRSLAFVLKRIHNTKTYDEYVKKFFDLFEQPKTWNNFESSWSKIAQFSKTKNVPIGSVVFPLFGIALDKNYPFHPIHTKVQSLMDKLSIPSLDLYQQFEGLPLDRMQVIVGQDFHPNEICHRMAAEAILKWFGDAKLSPSQFLPKVSYPERIGTTLSKTDKATTQAAKPVVDDRPELDDLGNVVESSR
jgi:lysophospholipase L1-like esterase